MGIAIFPAASAGITVAEGSAAGWGATQPQWNLITSTTSIANTYTFNSISGYRYLKLIAMDFTTTGTSPLLTFNSVTSGYTSAGYGQGETGSIAQNINSDGIYLSSIFMAANSVFGGTINIFDVNTSLPVKRVESEFHFPTGNGAQTGVGLFKNSSAITSISIRLNISSFQAASGGLFLYGAN